MLKWIADIQRKTISKPSSEVKKSRWHFVQGSTAVFLEPEAHTMLPACLAAGRYGRWLEIIVFNNADHHKSSWEITLNITLGL